MGALRMKGRRVRTRIASMVARTEFSSTRKEVGYGLKNP